ncbi:MAG: thioesterase family protein [Rhizobiaceae bacterium]
MTGALETQRSFVNSWECDENLHMNIQFYWKRFGDAAQIFFHLAGADRQNWIDRHVRYHGELMMATNTIVRSSMVAGKNMLVHELINGDTDAVSATAIDLYDNPLGGSGPSVEVPNELALPKSLPSAPIQIFETDKVIETGLGVVSHRSVITPQECDQDGRLLDQYHIARFSDAASHLWHHLGVTRAWMRDNNLGTVAVEMKASRHKHTRVGTMIEVVTWLEALGNKTFSFRHQISDMASGETLYSGAVTALLMDLTKRRAVPLPDVLREQFNQRMS